jgi:alpha-1,2-mannosyltransferase
LAGSPQQARLVWLVLAAAAVVVGLALAARLDRSGEPLLGIGVAAVTGLLVSPISWNHHWVWFLPLAIALTARAIVTGSRVDRWVAGGWVATFCLASISWWPFAGQDDYHLGAVYTVAADCYVLAAIAVLAMVGFAAGRGGHRPATPAGFPSTIPTHAVGLSEEMPAGES